jgi:hypothetical protein
MAGEVFHLKRRGILINCAAPIQPLTVIKRNSPWALTAEIIFNPNRAPVLLTTGVFPLNAHVMPA